VDENRRANLNSLEGNQYRTSLPIRSLLAMILMLHGARWILRPRCTGRSMFGRTMIRIRCQRGQGHIGHAIRSFRLRLLLRL